MHLCGAGVYCLPQGPGDRSTDRLSGIPGLEEAGKEFNPCFPPIVWASASPTPRGAHFSFAGVNSVSQPYIPSFLADGSRTIPGAILENL